MAAGVSAVAVRMPREQHGSEEEDDRVKNSEKGQSNALVTRDLLGAWHSKLGTMDLKIGGPEIIAEPSSSTFNPLIHDDLKIFPQKNITVCDEDYSRLELKLFPSSPYQSVCTLDKVKSALDRAHREDLKQQQPSLSSKTQTEEEKRKIPSSSSSYISSSSSPSSSFAAACPSCLIYIIAWKNNPVCPKCNSTLHPPSTPKRPRIDLNSNAAMFHFDL